MTFPRVAWCGLAVVAFHNGEEALTIATWLPPRLAQLEAQFRIQPLAADPGRLYVGLVVATLIPALWVAMAFRSPPRSAGAYSIIVLYGFFLANAFVPHLLGTCCSRATSRERSPQVRSSFRSRSGWPIGPSSMAMHPRAAWSWPCFSQSPYTSPRCGRCLASPGWAPGPLSVLRGARQCLLGRCGLGWS